MSDGDDEVSCKTNCWRWAPEIALVAIIVVFVGPDVVLCVYAFDAMQGGSFLRFQRWENIEGTAYNYTYAVYSIGMVR